MQNELISVRTVLTIDRVTDNAKNKCLPTLLYALEVCNLRKR